MCKQNFHAGKEPYLPVVQRQHTKEVKCHASHVRQNRALGEKKVHQCRKTKRTTGEDVNSSKRYDSTW